MTPPAALLLLSALAARPGLGLQCATPKPSSSLEATTSSRREALLLGASLLVGDRVAAASGDDGSLPDGPLQFQRFMRVKAEWSRLGSRLKDPQSEIDDDEWEAVGLFLRKLYDEGDDMSFLARNLDSSKRAQTKDLADAFRSSVKQADRPCRAHDRTAVAAAYDDSSRILDTFLGVLQDIPDEL